MFNEAQLNEIVSDVSKLNAEILQLEQEQKKALTMGSMSDIFGGRETAPDEIRKTFAEICDEHGYKVIEHTTITEDRYHLKLFRLSSKVRDIEEENL